jgi:hypothetical protein
MTIPTTSARPRCAAPARPRRRTFAVVLALTVALLGIALLAWLAINPVAQPGDASAVHAAFLGYTNNAAGKQVVVFSITNRSQLAVRREWYYEVQVLTGGNWAPQPTVQLPYGYGPVIHPNQSEIWTINVPTAAGRWRVWFPYVAYHGRLREMKTAIRRELRGLGLPFKTSGASYIGLTDEVQPPRSP